MFLSMNKKDIGRLAEIIVREADVLKENIYYQGALYLLCYAFECAIKVFIPKLVN
jgi:hypothetical protein